MTENTLADLLCAYIGQYGAKAALMVIIAALDEDALNHPGNPRGALAAINATGPTTTDQAQTLCLAFGCMAFRARLNPVGGATDGWCGPRVAAVSGAGRRQGSGGCLDTRNRLDAVYRPHESGKRYKAEDE